MGRKSRPSLTPTGGLNRPDGSPCTVLLRLYWSGVGQNGGDFCGAEERGFRLYPGDGHVLDHLVDREHGILKKYSKGPSNIGKISYNLVVFKIF